MKHLQLPVVVLFSVLLLGCEKNSLGTIDVATDIPQLSNAFVSPDSVYIDNLTPVNSLYAISTTVKVKMSFRGGDQTLTARVLQPTTSQDVSTISLRDDGIAPDQAANDSVYSGKIDFNIERAFAGRYRIQFSSTTTSGITSNKLEKGLKVARRNSIPMLSTLNAPDSLVLPPGDSLLINMNVTAADSDGLADIREVFFRSLDSSDPNRHFLLRDDGNSDRTNQSGDERAGDGVYSIIVKLTDTPTVRRTFHFAFQAADSFNDTSRTILHSLKIK